jgi:hypothetical protein
MSALQQSAARVRHSARVQQAADVFLKMTSLYTLREAQLRDDVGHIVVKCDIVICSRYPTKTPRNGVVIRPATDRNQSIPSVPRLPAQAAPVRSGRYPRGRLVVFPFHRSLGWRRCQGDWRLVRQRRHVSGGQTLWPPQL